MDAKKRILSIIEKRVLILDGATGTELQRRGMPQGACPEQWCLENQGIIKSIHKDYMMAGSDVVYTCTFGANRVKLSQYGSFNIQATNRKLAELARDAVGENMLIAGDIGPTGRFVQPFGDLEFEEAVDIFKEQVKGLLEGSVDLFIIETQMDIQEARAALIAVKETCDKFTMVTMTYEKGGRTLNGTDPVSALVTLESLGADAVGCNCSTGPEGMIPYIEAMKPHASVPLVAKPNAGMPRLVNNKTIFDMKPETFASFGRAFLKAGVNILGGCCGTRPGHIKSLTGVLEGKRPRPPRKKAISALSSARKSVILGIGSPLVIIGERINPTGKKDLQKELIKGKTTIVLGLAREQEEKDASLLDVNVGMPDIDEAETLKRVIYTLSPLISSPLVIDSSSIEAIETALRIYPGRAMVNSISGETHKIERLLPLVKKYGAMFILLPLTDKELPATSRRRKEIIKDILGRAQEIGVDKSDIVVDGLTMTVSASPGSAKETLETIRWCTRSQKLLTVVGLSNISFGLPQRKWVNSAFLAMAIHSGLSMAIANPSSAELMAIKMASDVLTQRDKDAGLFISYFATSGQSSGQKPVAKEEASPAQNVYMSVLEGNREGIIDHLDKAIATGMDAYKLVNEIMIPAIMEVGDMFDRKEYFLPQLIASAEAMKKGFEHLKPLLEEHTSQEKGTIVLATVKGDIHDIGKNIVALMLRNHGFKVIDLGKDVTKEEIIKAIKKYNPLVVGLSALMTTTMVNMRDVIELASRHGLNCKFIVGGAVVTRAYANSIGAVYAKDAVEAARVAERLSS